MGIGISLLLLAAGAILAFAVDLHAAGVDLHVVGWVLMGVGALGLIISLIMFAPRRRRVVSETTEPRVAAESPVVRRSTTDDTV
jgi:hypothetical protein